MISEKHGLVLFVILLVVGIGGAVTGSVNNSKDGSSLATPTPISELFNTAGASNSNLVSENNLTTPKQFVQQVSKSASTPTLAPTPSVKQYRQFPGILAPEELNNQKAVIETDKGNIELEIYPEATKAASNFIFLSRDGFYDGLTFHRVEPKFVIQGGDPYGNGTGGPGYKFDDEPVTRKYEKGIVAMANAGPNTNGSQFFIMLEDHPELPAKYTILGKVIKGQDIVDKISKGDLIRSITIIRKQ